MAVINGTTGNDTLAGTSGNDTINGLGGNDLFVAGANGANDFIDGGSGTDSIEYRDRATSAIVVDFVAGTITGGGSGTISFVSIERVVATNFNDSLTGTAGTQTLTGQGGADTLWGAAGVDTLWGGSGADTFIFREVGTANADRISDWTSGSDKLLLDGSVMTALGTGNFVAGDARFAANSTGTAQDASDRIIFNTTTGQVFYDADGNGAAAAQLIATLQTGATLVATDIVVEGGEPGQVINGTPGNDSLVGTEGNDAINGLGGNDTIDGQGGNDTLDGGTGDDFIMGTGRVLGGEGNDVLETPFFAAGDTTLFGGAGNDTLFGFQELQGEDGDDLLHADPPAAVLMNGGVGNDTVWNFDLNDTVDGGAGSDTVLVFEQRSLILNLATGTVSDKTGAASASLLNVENINRLEQEVNGQDDHTYYFDDYLIGNSAANFLQAGSGNDTVDGGLGNDTLNVGGFADDVITFSSAAGSANADVILGFQSGSMHLQLELAAYANLGARGNFVSGDARFAANATGTAQDASDRVVYNTTTGQLWYDADGNGAGAAQLIATLQGAPVLAATDIAAVDSRSVAAGTAGNDWMAGRDGYVNDSFNGGAGNDRFDGREGNDTILGGDGNDTLDGGDGADLMVGGAGNDTLRKGSEVLDAPAPGPDTLDGGLGDDTYELNFFVDTSAGQSFSFDFVLQDAGGVDTVVVNESWTLGTGFENLTVLASEFGSASGTGNSANNVIRSVGSTSDLFVLDGAGGNDTLIGGDGQEEFVFSVAGNYGNDSVDGGAGDFDVLNFDGASSAIVADVRAGTLTGGGVSGAGSVMFANIDQIRGGSFADQLTANDAGVSLVANGGNDTLVGGAGADSLFGGDGNDSIVGGAGNDLLNGHLGADRFLFNVAPSSSNADSIVSFTTAALSFATGEDKIQLDSAAHTNIGAAGNFVAGDARFVANASGTAQDASDRVIYNTTNGELWYDADGNGADAAQLIATLFDLPTSSAPTLVATDIEVVGGVAGGQVINGTAANDTLTGTAGDDTINGLGGNDLFVAGANGGSDVVDGGTGIDSIEYRDRATSALVVDFGAGTITGGGSGTMSFTSIERVVASNFNDTLTGNAAAQTLTGQAGADTLWGAGGLDTLWGGGGADTFIFREMGTANADRISDWASGSDKVALENSVFSAIGAAGNFVAGDGRFFAAAGATSGHDANDRVIYNTSTGSLYYDADGSGVGAAQLIATFSGNPAVAATDITVI